MIYIWPTDWYRFTKITFRIQSRSQMTPKTWLGGRSVYGPHAQLFVASMALAVQEWDGPGQAMAAFFSRLDGIAGRMRIGDTSRREPQYNRINPASSSPWSDSTFFNDGSGWTAGLMPASAFVAASVARGSNSISIKGLPLSTSRALRRGDLFELQPGGVATDGPNLYEVQTDGDTDGTGATGVEIRPRLRQGFAINDTVVLQDPTSVFRVTDDNQGAAEWSMENVSTQSFSLIEDVV